MLCEHCGKRQATFYCKSNINGRVTQVHLCPACAAELGYTQSFSTDFFGENLMERFFRPMFSDFGGNLLTEFPMTETEEEPTPRELLQKDEVTPLQQQRRRNSLQARLKEAVENENYEEAARLRDALRALPPQ